MIAASNSPAVIVSLRVEGSGIEHSLDPHRPAFMVGTSAAADIRVTDPRVSRFHCGLMWDEGQLLVIDRGSRNGTWINDVRCQRAFLHDGARLRIGRTTLVVGSAARTVERGLERLIARWKRAEAAGLRAEAQRIAAEISGWWHGRTGAVP
jgi:pSer/pThr/pTyr-binding forkhead associated (FHA) protein